MMHRRSVNKKRPGTSNGRYQLRVEPLEARRLLAGLQVSVFVDQDGSRTYDQSVDSSAANRLVYIDLDSSGGQSAGDPIRVTDDSGRAFFEGLADGDYSVGILTNPNSQRQTTHTGVAPVATLHSPQRASLMLADADLEHVWSVDSNGIANSLNPQSTRVDLHGPVIDSWMISEGQVGLVVESRDDAQPLLVEFHLETGQISHTEIEGIHSGDAIRQIVQTSSGNYALIDSDFGTALGRLSIASGTATITNPSGIDAHVIATVPGSQFFASATQTPAGGSLVSLQAAHSSSIDLEFIELDGSVESLVASSDGELLFASMQGGGINVLRILDDQLQLEAILAGASGPVSASSVDGRVLTASSANSSEVVVWDSTTWQPLGMSHLGIGPNAATGSPHLLITDSYGDTGLVATPDGIYSVELAASSLRMISVRSGESSTADFGVRVRGPNSAPDVAGFGSRAIEEDNVDQIAFESHQGIVDSDGDQLWFTLATPPAEGRVVPLASGWKYEPDANYNGADSAVWLVHDGLVATELVVRWEIAPVNDPPLAMFVQLPTLAENAPLGSSIGFVSIVDADRDAEYRVTTSDPRFVVESGQVFFASGQLDFDTEAIVDLEVTAIDKTNPDFRISKQTELRLTNINEPPLALALESETFLENDPGARIGRILVDDPDAASEYDFAVSDDRFEVRDGVLHLVEGQAFDHETESEVVLTVTAREAESSHEISREISLTVGDANDPPGIVSVSRFELEGDTEGAVIGEVSVEDPDGDVYQFVVSDERFEVVDGLLKLRDGVTVDFEPDASLSLTVVATANNGDQASNTIPLAVVRPRSPHQNPNNPTDVNGDGDVTPIDALILINEINKTGGGPLPEPGGGTGERPTRPDVNGDGVLSPIDVLMVINKLNGAGDGEGEGEAQRITAEGDRQDRHFAGNDAVPLDDPDRRKQNSEIDAELEQLLEELSRQRLSNS